MTTNLARRGIDPTDIRERERLFQHVGHLLGVTLLDRDLADAALVDFDDESDDSDAPLWVHQAAAYGFLCVAIAYLVDIAVEYDHEALDFGSVGDHLVYLLNDSGLGLDSEAGPVYDLVSDPEWYETALHQVVNHHWAALECLIARYEAGLSPVPDIERGILMVDAPCRWSDSFA